MLRSLEVVEQRRPQDASLHGDQPALGVKRQHAVQGARIDEQIGLAKLLTAHRVASAGNRNGLSLVSRISYCRGEFADLSRVDDCGDAGCVQLRVDVIDEGAGRLWRDTAERC